jgi:hypothetical protein
LGQVNDAVLSDASSFGYVAHSRAPHLSAATEERSCKSRYDAVRCLDSSWTLIADQPPSRPVTIWNPRENTTEGTTSGCFRRLWGGGGESTGFWSPEDLFIPENPLEV